MIYIEVYSDYDKKPSRSSSKQKKFQQGERESHNPICSKEENCYLYLMGKKKFSPVQHHQVYQPCSIVTSMPSGNWLTRNRLYVFVCLLCILFLVLFFICFSFWFFFLKERDYEVEWVGKRMDDLRELGVGRKECDLNILCEDV